MNIKVFTLMSKINETRYVSWHETWKCKCRLDGSVCNDKQHWNNYKCRCEYKELIDKGNKNYEIFGIQVCMNVNVINHLIMRNIYFMQIVNVEKKLTAKLVLECEEQILNTIPSNTADTISIAHD